VADDGVSFEEIRKAYGRLAQFRSAK